MKPWPWFGKSRARDALHALAGGLPENPGWLDGERVEATMSKQAVGCWLCGDASLESDSLPGGGVALHVRVCTEHVQLAARRALVRQLAKMADGVRERLERP